MSIWVYKDDGTRECGLGTEIELAKMEEQLAKIVGEKNILDRTKGQLPGFFGAWCGGPNGHVNLYELTPEGYKLLEGGFVGPLGFQLWIYGPVRGHDGITRDFAGPETPFPLSTHDIGFQVGATPFNPVLVRELLGHDLRVIRPGDDITLDLRFGRVNIFVDEKNTIKEIRCF